MKDLMLIIIFLFSLGVIGQDLNEVDSVGFKQGKWVYQDSTGLVNTYCNYVDDLLDGDYIVMDEKECLLYSVVYKKGKKVGLEKTYYKNNRIKEISYYDEVGLISTLKFDYNGSLYEDIEFKNGVKHGVHREYENGFLYIQRSYINGKLDGYEIYYNKKGKIKMIIEYEDDILKEIKKY